MGSFRWTTANSSTKQATYDNQSVRGRENTEVRWKPPIPVFNGHSAGDSFSAPAFADESLEDIANAMATPHFGKPYMSTRINSAALGASAKIGIDHPYVGLAGKPTFTKSTLTFGVTSGSLDTVHTSFFAPRTSSGDNTFSQLFS